MANSENMMNKHLSDCYNLDKPELLDFGRGMKNSKIFQEQVQRAKSNWDNYLPCVFLPSQLEDKYMKDNVSHSLDDAF